MNNTELFNLYIVPNIKYAKYVTNYFVQNKFYVDDVFNDVLIHIFHYIHTYDPGHSNIRAWLYVAVKNSVYRQIRKYNENATPTDDFRTYGSTDFHRQLPMSAEELKSGVFGFSDRTFTALSSLNDKDIDIILLRCNGYSFYDMAKIYNSTYQAIKSRFYKVRHKFITNYSQASTMENF